MKITCALDFQVFYNKVKSQTLRVKLAYKLNKLNSRLSEEAEFYRSEFYKILTEYAQKDENGEFIQNENGTGYLIKEGKTEECREKIQELQDLEIENLDITFTLEELEHLAVTPEEISAIMNLIVD